jgi:chemotaxis protein CheY-P-specific phosphatase CheC
MVITIPTVNGLAPEILFFVKKLDAKQLADRILGGELEEPPGLALDQTERSSPMVASADRITTSAIAMRPRRTPPL